MRLHRLLAWFAFAAVYSFILSVTAFAQSSILIAFHDTLREQTLTSNAHANNQLHGDSVARYRLKSRDTDFVAAHSSHFPTLKSLAVETLLGGWEKAQRKHIADGGGYDQNVVKR